jgi:predicted transposase YdaD
VVIYLKHPGNSRAVPPYQLKLPNGKVVHDFSFSVIELYKLEAEQLFRTGLKGILPLVPLTRDGQQHDTIERVIEELQQPGVKKQEELLASTYGLAGLAFKKESDHLWLKRRFAMLEEVLEESWTLQEILNKGLAEGLKKGLKEGLREGRKEGREEGREEGQLQVQRQNLILLIQARFPALVQLAQDVCNVIQVFEELQGLFQKVLLAKDELEVRQLLLDAQK